MFHFQFILTLLCRVWVPHPTQLSSPWCEMLASHTGGPVWEISTAGGLLKCPKRSPQKKRMLNNQLTCQHLHSTSPGISCPKQRLRPAAMKQTQQQLKLVQAKADLKSWAWHKVGENPEAISALAGHRMAEVKCLGPAPSPLREAQNWGCAGPHSHLLHRSIGP